MKYNLNRSLIYLALTDLGWYISTLFLYISSFYLPILDVIEQSQNAIKENTDALLASGDPLTTQISIDPYSQLLVSYILLFIALAALLGLLAEFVKTKIIYKKVFWLKTIALQVSQCVLFFAFLYVTKYFLDIQFEFPLIPLGFMITLIAAIWAFYFWFIAQGKAYIYAKKKFKPNTLWMVYALVGICVLLVSFKLYELVIIASLVWLVGWNWLQLHIASFK